MRSRTQLLVLFGVAVALAGAWYALHLGLTVAAGVKAKAVCSGVFVSGRSAEAVEREDMAAYASPFLDLVRAEVDARRGTVRASVPLVAQSVAVFRESLGCTLAAGGDPGDLVGHAGAAGAPRPAAPLATRAIDGERGARLARVVAAAFDEPDAERARRTRAVVVVQDGRVVAERYAPGFPADMRLPGWSMAKSVTATLVGILVREGKLDPARPLGAPEWAGDARNAIALGDFLRMSSGLGFEESYFSPFSDVNRMLFASRDTGAAAAAKPLEAAPGTRWSYSSGTSNIVARAMRGVFPLHDQYLAFPRRALFDRIGMASAVFEPDASGTFVGSSFLFATARDWARLGILYAQDGVWEGERLLPEGWVRYSATPAPAAPKGQYGAHWWLALEGASPAARLPADAFHAAGHGGQYVTVVPSRGVVVVRLGLALARGAWDQTAFVAEVLDALGRD